MNESGFGHALYYPYIHIQNEKWLKTSALYYDKLSRIVPEQFVTHDNDIVKQLIEEEGFITDITPGIQVDDIAKDFLEFAKEKLAHKNNRKKIVAKIGKKIPSKSNYKIHMCKMGILLRRELPKLCLAKRLSRLSSHNSGWFHLEPVTGALYMAHLANKIAEERGLPIVTDDSAYQPLIRGIQLDRYPDRTDKGHALASLVIETAVPENIESISVNKIIEFRKIHNAERHEFYEGVRAIAKDIPRIEDHDSLQDCLNHHKKTIENAVNNLKFSFKAIGISCGTGLLGLSVPSWASSIAEKQSTIGVQVVSGGLICMATGVLLKEGVNYYKSRKESPWSYVLSLEKLKSVSFIEELLHGTF
ncbi:MAG: hypothetical protein GY928_03385 [Colwellia sp.]|nr:hypothetical protein [Colwellia sp.]